MKWADLQEKNYFCQNSVVTLTCKRPILIERSIIFFAHPMHSQSLIILLKEKWRVMGAGHVENGGKIVKLKKGAMLD